MFSSQNELLSEVATALRVSTAISSALAQHLAERVVAELREADQLRITKETGSISYCRSGATDRRAGVVFQFTSTHEPETREEDLAACSEEVRANLLSLLEAAPLGVSCADFTMWCESGFADVHFSPAGICATVLDFVLAEEAELSKRRPDCAFFHPPGSSDCFSVPVVRDSGSREAAAAQFVAALKTRDAAASAAWCLSAHLGLVDGPFLTALLNSFTLQCFEAYGVDAVPRLCKELLDIAFALPIGSRSGSCPALPAHHAQVLAMCLEALAYAAKLSFETAQQCALDLARGCKDRTVVRRLLAAASPSVASSLLPLLHKTATALAGASAKLLLPSPREGAEPTSSRAADCPPQPIAAASAASDSGPSANGPQSDVESAKPGEEVEQAQGSLRRVGETSAQEAAVLRLLEKDFHYTEMGRCRPSGESPEGRKLQQALQLLSANLYSSQAHFVMELVQNADDNDYHPSATPTLRVQLFPHAVVVFNNEVGFSERNIVAVCNVNGSTKLHKSGYIGQKGIG
jgi:hypothetical protein